MSPQVLNNVMVLGGGPAAALPSAIGYYLFAPANPAACAGTDAPVALPSLLGSCENHLGFNPLGLVGFVDPWVAACVGALIGLAVLAASMSGSPRTKSPQAGYGAAGD